MRERQGNAGKVRGVHLFGSLHSALESTFEILALHEAIKCPGYGVPTANGTATAKVSTQDKVTQAVWVYHAAKEALTPAQFAVVVCAYDGAGEARRAAIDTLCAEFNGMTGAVALLRAVLEREFVFGEPWCESLPAIAHHVGISLRTTERMAERVRKAIAAVSREVRAALHAEFSGRGWLPKHAA